MIRTNIESLGLVMGGEKKSTLKVIFPLAASHKRDLRQ